MPIPPQPHCRPGNSPKVFVLSLPRTGNRSMWQALQILGYPSVSHGFDCVDWPEIGSEYESFVDKKWFSAEPKVGNGEIHFARNEWDAVLNRYDAIVDWPASFFATDIVDAYPDAKFIYTHRPVDKWYDSNAPMIREMFAIPITLMRFMFEPFLGYRSAAMSQKSYQGFYGAKDAEGILQNAKQRYQQHWEAVKERILAAGKEEQLLEYELGSGWEPLCRFLGKKVPKGVEFPWVNEQTELMRKMKEVEKTRGTEFLVQCGKVVIAPVAVAWAVWRCWGSMSW